MKIETIIDEKIEKLKRLGVENYINDELDFNFELLANKEIVVFGCSNSIAKEFIKNQKYFKIVTIFDDYHRNKTYEDIPVKKSSEIEKYKNYVAINLTFSFNAYSFFYKISLKNNIRMFNYFEISQFFKFKSEYPYFNNILEETLSNFTRIKNLVDFFDDGLSRKIINQHLIFRLTFDPMSFMAIKDNFNDQYFDIWIDKNEVFIDGGSFDGKTTEILLKKSEEIGKVYCFEPDLNNFNMIKGKFNTNEKIIINNIGLWDIETQKFFLSTSDEISRVVNYSDKKIDLNAIDNIASDATFIKLDIEGSEKEALKGAKNTIESNLPKLAISIYHHPNDLFEIQNLITKYTNKYKFHIRHYSDYMFDTILYGIAK